MRMWPQYSWPVPTTWIKITPYVSGLLIEIKLATWHINWPLSTVLSQYVSAPPPLLPPWWKDIMKSRNSQVSGTSLGTEMCPCCASAQSTVQHLRWKWALVDKTTWRESLKSLWIRKEAALCIVGHFPSRGMVKMPNTWSEIFSVFRLGENSLVILPLFSWHALQQWQIGPLCMVGHLKYSFGRLKVSSCWPPELGKVGKGYERAVGGPTVLPRRSAKTNWLTIADKE